MTPACCSTDAAGLTHRWGGKENCHTTLKYTQGCRIVFHSNLIWTTIFIFFFLAVVSGGVERVGMSARLEFDEEPMPIKLGLNVFFWRSSYSFWGIHHSKWHGCNKSPFKCVALFYFRGGRGGIFTKKKKEWDKSQNKISSDTLKYRQLIWVVVICSTKMHHTHYAPKIS